MRDPYIPRSVKFREDIVSEMSKMTQVGLTVAGALLLPWLVCAQAAGADAAAPKKDAKRATPAAFFGVGAKEPGQDAPQRETLISADKIDFDNKEGVILFDSNVLIDDAQFIMRSDRLMVFLEGTNDVSQILAIGNVNITNELRYATCDKAVYTKKDAQIVMTADIGKEVNLVTQGDTAGTVKGASVVIWLDDERVQVLSREGENRQPGVTIPSLGTLNRATGGEKK